MVDPAASNRVMRSPPIELGEFLLDSEQVQEEGHELTKIISAIELAAKLVNRDLRGAGLADVLGDFGSMNVQGEQQQKLDAVANETFINVMTDRKLVCGVCSEEEEFFVPVNHNARHVLLTDPLDGSSNIDVNVSVGTIFSIYKRLSPIGTPPVVEDFLQPGSAQVAAGYVLYGSSTMMVFCTSQLPVNGFTLDESVGTFYLSHPNIRFPAVISAYSINEGNFKSFPSGVKEYLKYCQDGCRYNLLYIGSLVSDFHRNLLDGGIYIYPATEKDKNGKLRLLYECNPMAFLAEKADGAASDGFRKILDILPQKLHQRTPIAVGPKESVQLFQDMMKEHNPELCPF